MISNLVIFPSTSRRQPSQPMS